MTWSWLDEDISAANNVFVKLTCQKVMNIKQHVYAECRPNTGVWT